MPVLNCSTSRRRRALRAIAVAMLSLLLLLASTAPSRASTFSFGSILPTDIVHSLVIAPLGGTTPTVEYDANTLQLTVSGYISTINFLNRGPISINPGDVWFSSQLMQTSYFAAPPLFPGQPVTLASGTYSSTVDDFTILDTLGTGGGPIMMMALL